MKETGRIPLPFFDILAIVSLSYLTLYGVYQLVSSEESHAKPATQLKQKGGRIESFSTPTWAVIQYDDRPLSEHFKKLQERTKEYCNRHGYTHIFSDKPYDLPPYWRKVQLAKETLESGNYKGVLWLDTDATIHDLEKSIDSFLLPKKSFYYSPDNPNWSSNFCAGVWIVLNSADGKRIVTDWMNEYRPNDWRKEADGKWVSHGSWAGDTYEQGAFSNKVLPKHHDKAHALNWTVLQGDKVEPDSFTLHFAGGDKDKKIDAYFASLK